MFSSWISAAIWATLAVSVVSKPCAEKQQLLLQSDDVQWRVGFGKKEPPGVPGPPRPPIPPHPHPPHQPPNVENKTIFQALSEEPRFSRLFKLVNFTEEIVSTLNDSSASVSFFAVPNWGLRPPGDHKKGPHPPEEDEEHIISEILSKPTESERFASLEGLLDRSDDDNDHKKEVIKSIIRAVLSYHILPAALPAAELAKNLTHPTSLKLKDGSLDGQALRVRIAVVPKPLRPAIFVNYFAKVIVPDIKAKNGYIHVVDHPIGPPPSTFQILFLVSDVFSTFTSALQRVDLTDAADWRYVPGEGDEKGTVEGSPSVTVFAPTNKAFKKLPKKLQFFLFSPFGERALKKLLQFHIAPEYILHSNWQYNATESILAEDMFFDCDEDFDDDVFIHELFSDISLAAFTDGHHGGHQHETRGISGTLHKLHSLFDGPPHPNHPHPGPPPPPGPPGPHPHPGPPPPPPSGPPHFPHQEPVYALNVSVPTLLANHSLNVHIIQFEHRSPLPPHRSFFPTRVIVQGHPVLPDIVARNGAVHVVDRVLNPIKHHHHHKHHHDHDRGPDDGVAAKDEWEDWEEWLPKWAEEN